MQCEQGDADVAVPRKAARRKRPPRPNATANSILELERKLKALLAEHTVATVENQRLKNRLGVIEALLPVRVQPGEDLARLCSNSADAAWGRGCQHRRRSSSAEQASRSESAADDHSAGHGQGHGPIAAGAGGPTACAYDSPADGHSHAAGCCSPGCKSELGRRQGEPGTAGGAEAALAARPLGGPQQQQQQQEQPRLSPALDRRSHPEQPSQHDIEAATKQWLAAWRVWVREAALLSVAYTARPSELYLRQIDAAFERVCEEGARIWYPLGHPDVICGAVQLNVDTGRPETPPDSHWKEVVEGMAVSGQQVAACRTTLALYRERMEVVLAERCRLTERLAESMAAAAQAEEAPHAAAGPSESAGSAHYQQVGVEAAAAAAALDANVAAEGRATRLAREFLRSNILSSLQRARCAALSYPFYPDALAIIAAMAALPDQPLGNA
ncbi:hypothetical protein HXX76_002721 [Chlamydomonas incerta]|uniref:Uncharacterized protein n=1 Tax=Chlamydomonas incerta TaxID=51695 RepID=A0A835TF97_CHLIN|nr:hypothetical protein HXX76_002721 [Chlamydomonas incerta]|eukprot:KAG2442637.1 hypothetical protein HXX76_002721 [Chlamydomonas incerta]